MMSLLRSEWRAGWGSAPAALLGRSPIALIAADNRVGVTRADDPVAATGVVVLRRFDTLNRLNMVRRLYRGCEQRGQ